MGAPTLTATRLVVRASRPNKNRKCCLLLRKHQGEAYGPKMTVNTISTTEYRDDLRVNISAALIERRISDESGAFRVRVYTVKVEEELP